MLVDAALRWQGAVELNSCDPLAESKRPELRPSGASLPPAAAWSGAVLVVVSSVAFSSKAIMAKLMYRHGVDPVTVLALRMGFAAPLYLGMAWWSSRHARALTRREVGAILLLGLVGYYGSSLCDFLGLQYVSAGLERLILFTYPTWVVLLSAVFVGERLRHEQLIALGVTYAGIALVFATELDVNMENVWLGSALVLASALAYAGYLVGGAPYIRRLGPERFTSFALLVSTGAVLLHFTATPQPLLGHAKEVYALGLLMALVATVLPTFALAQGIRRIGAGPSAILGLVGPVSTLFLANLFLGEPILPLQLVGTGLVLAGASVVATRSASTAAKR